MDIVSRLVASIITMSLLMANGYTMQDVDLLSQVIYHENWHTDAEKKTAYWTGAVVMNRVKSDKFPNTIHDVLYQRGQYSTTKKFFTKEIPKECYEMARKILAYGTPDVPKNVLFQSQQPKLGRGHWKVLNGEYFAYG